MTKGLYIAYTGMINEQRRMDVMTNNLANADTTGYKKEGATSQSFNDVLALKIKDTSEGGSGRNVRSMGQMQPGVKIGENYVDYSMGPFKETKETFDLALSDSGFFNIEFTNREGEASTKYSRDGNFTLNANGEIVNHNGDFLLSTRGAHIRVDPLQPTLIYPNGEVVQNGTAVATIAVTDFENTDYLRRYGENYFETIEGAVPIQQPANTQVISGYLEMSNVSIVTEMVNMIAIQRQYDANQKVILTHDSTLDIAVNQLGRVNA